MSTATLSLPYPPSVNAMYRNSGHRGRAKTGQYKDWQHEAGWQMNQQRIPRFSGPVTIRYTFGAKKGRFDLSNFIKPIDDLLVLHKIIPDDNSKVIVGFTVEQDPNVEGVLVHVSALQESEDAA